MSPMERLRHLYAEVAAHTWSDCEESCTMQPRFGCCHRIFCNIVIRHAARVWDVTLERTDHPTLPLMGDEGCTAAPHLRPTCAKHSCEVNPLGHTGGNQPSEWMDRYRALLGEIESLEDSLELE